MGVFEMSECSNEIVTTEFLIEKINHIRKELRVWHEKEFDVVKECDRLQQDLLYFENKLNYIKGSNDSTNI